MKNYKGTFKHNVWLLLEWIDININHGVIESFVESDYELWMKTTKRFCDWIMIDISDKWFPEENED